MTCRHGSCGLVATLLIPFLALYPRVTLAQESGRPVIGSPSGSADSRPNEEPLDRLARPNSATASLVATASPKGAQTDPASTLHDFGHGSPRPSAPEPRHELTQSSNAAQIARAGFLENKGQWDPRALFRFGDGQKTIWLTRTGLVFDNVRRNDTRSAATHITFLELLRTPFWQTTERHGAPVSAAAERLVFAEQLVNVSHRLSIEPVSAKAGVHNYLFGSDPSGWHTNVHTYSGVIYHNVWPGVDFRVTDRGADLEQEFVVHPSADLDRVNVKYTGIDNLVIAADGSLIIRTRFGELHESKPTVYQQHGDSRFTTEGRFRLRSRTAYTFAVTSPRRDDDLVLDPTLLYSTFLGGTNGVHSDTAQGIAIDKDGNAYVTGTTYSTDFPTTPGAFLRIETNGPGSAAPFTYVTKLSPLGDSLVYSTFVSRTAFPQAIAVDDFGDAYIGGRNAGSDFPITANALQPSMCANYPFLLKLNSQGSGILYSSCIGSGADLAYASEYGAGMWSLALDASGVAYMAGWGGDGLPTTPGAFQTQVSPVGVGNAYVAVVDTSLAGPQSLTYASFLGGANGIGSEALSVVLDQQGMMYVTGATWGSSPVTPGAFMTQFPGNGGCNENNTPCSAVFLSKLDPTKSGAASLVYSTYLGGWEGSAGDGVAVDGAGSAYITGYTGTWGTNAEVLVYFPTTPGAFQTTKTRGDVEAFVTKLTPDGSALAYSTLLGNQDSSASGIALDVSGDAYVGGTTRSATFPLTPDAFQGYPGGGGPYGFNGFLTTLSADGSALIYSTYLGGGQNDDGVSCIVVDGNGDAYVAGGTNAPDFPITPFAYQPVFRGTSESFIAKFALGSVQTLSITGISPNIGGNAGSVTATIVGIGLTPGTTAKLVCPGQPDIIATNVTVSTDGRTLSGTFLLVGTVAEMCNVVVDTTDGSSVADAGAFTIQPGGAANMWVDIVGLPRIRGGSSQNYYVAYGNTGTVDASNIVVSIVVPNLLTWQSQQDQIPVFENQTNGGTLLSFAVPVTPPSSSGAIVIALDAQPLGIDHALPFQLRAWINPE